MRPAGGGAKKGGLRAAFIGAVMAMSLVVAWLSLTVLPSISQTAAPYTIRAPVVVPSPTAVDKTATPSPTSVSLADETAAPSSSPTTGMPDSGPSHPVTLPYTYPVHTKLPTPKMLASGIAKQFARKADCVDMAVPPLPIPPTTLPRHTPSEVDVASLSKKYLFTAKEKESLFLKHGSRGLVDDVWWVAPSGNIPCTVEAQRFLARHQHPANCNSARFLATRLKEGSHGLGSALSLVVHDLLSAVLLGRVLAIERSQWFFSPPGMGWEAYFTPPTHCPIPPDRPATLTSSASHRTARVVKKKSIDLKGIGRNDLPDLRTTVGATCAAEVTRWTSDSSNVYLMGTFARGADPLLFWWMAQGLRYLVREPHPWFTTAVYDNLAKLGYPWKGGAVFQQLRGEVAKFREYYNVFGCHDVALPLYPKATQRVLGNDSIVYISGNTPMNKVTELREMQKALRVRSTWDHPAAQAETTRWGADSLIISWVDFWGGVAASGWVCIVQSNWCRMINLLRLTAGRAQCPFIDLGLVMMADPESRGNSCVVKEEWPKKPFSNILKRNELG